MNNAIRKGDFWCGLILALLGSYIIFSAAAWTYVGEDGPGAGFFPMWYGIAMLACSLLMVAGTILKHDPNAKSRLKWPEVKRSLVCWLAFALCIGLLNVLGFMVSFALMTWFLIAFMFRKPHRTALMVAIGGAVCFYLIFSVGLDLQLPAGIFA